MHIYDTLIVGSGYFSAGYALKRGNCIICEEHQICDTGFYLPLRSFSYTPYIPQTADGRELLSEFESLSLFDGGMQELNRFELAFCRFAVNKSLKTLLKCRVISVEAQSDGVYCVTVQTNEGISALFARSILNTSEAPAKKRYTVLFVSDCLQDAEREKILNAFPEAEIEPAFYSGRYALHFSADGYDENTVKVYAYETWKTLCTEAKILYMAPVFYGEGRGDGIGDGDYGNPIMAFECGMRYADAAEPCFGFDGGHCAFFAQDEPTEAERSIFTLSLENGRVIKRACAEPSFDLTCDILCIGAGSAGVFAADSAAREGASVILCEIGENIGGMPVCGNVTGYYYGASGGSYEQDDILNSEDSVFLSNGRHWEQRQIRLTLRLAESGVNILCRHSAVGLYMEGKRVIGACVFDGKGIVNIGAGTVIDATSDGHIIRLTEVEKQYGRPADGCFVPFGVFLQYTEKGRLFSKNNDSGIMDHYNAADFSEKTVLAHANAADMMKGKEFVSLALHTGVREGLSFEGEERLTYRDVLMENHPEKILFWAYSDLDRHGSERATEEELFQNWYVISNLSTVLISIPVPLGSIVPKGIKGLISAGRCLCFDTYLQSAVRMNRDMFRMGECVGIAAAMAVKSGVALTEIDYSEYLSRVRERGCFDGYSERAFCFDNSYGHYLNKMKSLRRIPDSKYDCLAPNGYVRENVEFDVDKSFRLLKTDAPGVAIWSCFRAKDREAVRERLYREITVSDDILYRYNCAIALGLVEDRRALPVLREIVRNRDCFFFTDNRRTNQFRSAVAVCLIGRLGDAEDLVLLFDLLSERETERKMYRTLKANYLYHTDPDRNFVYFHMLTHACMAIVKIYSRCGLELLKLHEFFLNFFDGDTVIRRVTSVGAGEPAYEEMANFIEYILKITGENAENK